MDKHELRVLSAVMQELHLLVASIEEHIENALQAA